MPTPPYRVLVVEDHPVMREAYDGLLERAPDFLVSGIVGSAEEALAGEALGSADLLVADVTLPRMDGITLIEHVRVLRRDLAILVVSAHLGEHYARRAQIAGADGFIGKNDLAETLVPAMRDALACAARRSDTT